MVRIVRGKHEELENVLKVFISALLPHKNKELSSFETILEKVTKLIHIEEMEGEHYLIFFVAEQLRKILTEFDVKKIMADSGADNSMIDAGIERIVTILEQSVATDEIESKNILIEVQNTLIEADIKASMAKIIASRICEEYNRTSQITKNRVRSILTENKIRTVPTLTRDTLISILEVQLYDIVSVDGHGFSSMVATQGKRADNLKNPDTYEIAASIALNRCLELYDEAFEMAKSPEEAMSYLPSLRSNYVQAVLKEALEVQGELAYNTFDLREKKWDHWRKFIAQRKSDLDRESDSDDEQAFDGSMGWVDFIGWVSSSIRARIRESETEMKIMSSVNDAIRLREDVKEREAIIAQYGIPPIDIKRPIMKTRYTVLIGKPNLGKTTIAVNWLVNVLLEGKKVAIYSEETPESVMLYEYILPVYIYKKYGFFASYEQIIDEEEVGGINAREIEERRKMIKMAISDVAESGNYLYIPTLYAWKIYQNLKQIHFTFPFDYIVLDHSLSIPGGGETTARLNELSSGLKRFKNDFKTSICLLSHPSPDAKKIVSRAGASGLTRYSKQIEGDADDVFYMFDTPELEEKDLIGLIHTKGRGASKVLEIVYLTKMFKFKLIQFDPSRQASSGAADKAIAAIDNDPDFGDNDGDENYDSSDRDY